MLKRLSGVLLCAFLTTACDKKTEFAVPADREPSKKIGDSFKITKPIQSGLNKAQIAIMRSSLGKEFLLSAQMIQLPGVPQFNGSKSRVVLFVEEHGSVFMLEAPEGNIINNEIPASFVLAEFPIIQSTEQYVIFDFNEGTKQLYTASDWRASDFEGPSRNAETEFASVDVGVSFIKRAYMSASERLVIRQAAQVSVRAGANKNTNVEALYYISPYRKNLDFTPTESRGFERMGFFEVAPLLTDIDTKVYASKFDSAPVTYAVSANTPALYRDAVREGILYWNKAFGSEKLSAIIAPEGINAPNPDYNIVQWVNWDTAGMAYADAQMDPRTGQILHAQVFQTSVFAIANKNRARKYLRSLKDTKKASANKHIGLMGLTSKGLCNLDHNKLAKELAENIIALDADEETALRMSQDMVRHVVSHEIGHTLGLRHNFAGNLAANFDATEVDAKFQQYVEGNLDPDMVPTSSVMDYMRMQSAMPASELSLVREKAFSYDEAAIQSLYLGRTYTNTQLPLFCTDSHRKQYLGCNIWDHGRSPVLDLKRKKDIAVSEWSSKLIEKFIQNLTNPTSRRPNPSEVVLAPKGDLKMALSYRTTLLKLLAEDTKDIRVHRQFAKVDTTNAKKVDAAQRLLWTHEVNSLGGMSELLIRPSASLVSEVRSKALRLLNSTAYQSGIGYDGNPYTLTALQTRDTERVLEDYFSELERILAETDLETLTDARPEYVKGELSTQMEDVLYNRAARYLVAESGKEIVGDIKVGDEKSIRVTLPEYKYSHKLRISAIELLTNQGSFEMDFAYDQKASLKSTYEASLKSALLDNDITKVKVKESSGEARLWLLQNTELWNKLSSY